LITTAALAIPEKAIKLVSNIANNTNNLFILNTLQSVIIGYLLDSNIFKGFDRLEYIVKMKKHLFYQPINATVSTKTPGLFPMLEHTRRSIGIDIKYVNSMDEFLSEVGSRQYDSIGISITDTDLVGIIPQLDEARELDPNVPIILGGQGVYSLSSKLVRHKSIDICIEGEADNTFAVILDKLERGEAYYPISEEKAKELESATFERNYEGTVIYVPLSNIAFSTKNDIHILEESDEIKYNPAPTEEELNTKFNNLPWDIILEKNYPTISIYSQRGCPWNKCDFCGNIFGSDIRRYTPENVIKLIREAKDNGRDSVIFLDDMFTSSSLWVRSVLAQIKEYSLDDMNYVAELRIDTPNDLLVEMHEVGFNNMNAGLETVLATRVERLNKSNNPQQYVEKSREFIETCVKNNINTTLYMLWADPDSTLLEISQELKEVSDICVEMYEKYEKLPFFSSSTFEIFPVLKSPITQRKEYEFVELELSDGTILQRPTTFKKRDEIEKLIQEVDGFRIRNIEDFPIPGDKSTYLFTDMETNWIDMNKFMVFYLNVLAGNILSAFNKSNLFGTADSDDILENTLSSQKNFIKLHDLM